MEDILRLTLLFDFYGGLLSDKQREIFDMYYLQDYSLQEIGEQLSVSRQGVRAHLVRSQKLLADYEASLGLVEKYHLKKQQINKITEQIHELHNSQQGLSDLAKITLIDVIKYFENFED